jgi:O-antigen/teichoic acid export membrane protein
MFNLYKVIGIDFIIKVLAISISFLLIPMLIDVLQKEKYGIWIIFFSLLQWVSLIDFGVGNGLRNLIPKLVSQNKHHEINKYLFSGFVILLVVSIFGIAIFTLFSSYIFNPSYFGLNYNPDWFQSAILTFIFVFFIYLTLSVIKPLAYVINKPYLVSLLAFIPNMFLLIYIIYADWSNQPGLISIERLLLAYLFGMCSSFCFVFIYIVKKNKKVFSGSFYFCPEAAKKVLKSSADLFLLQVAAVLIYTMDNFIVANFFGTEAVTDFSVIVKLFSIYPLAIGILIGPLWNRITCFANDGDVVSATKLVHHYYVMFFLSLIFLTGLFFIAPYIFEVWLGEVNISYYMLLPFFLFNLTLGWGMIQSQVLNALNVVRIQWVLAILTPISRFIIVFYFVEYYSLGVESVMWAGFIVSIPITIIAPFLIRKALTIKPETS